MARGTSIKLGLGRLGSILLVAGGSLLAGFRLVLDLIGYSTIPEDVTVAQTRLNQFLELVLSIPWWAVWGFVLISTLWLIWVSWPRPQLETKLGPLENKGVPKPVYASSFEGKKPATAAIIPQRLIDEIDHDAANMAGCVRMHIVPIKIKRILDAPDPYLDITLRFWNETIYELRFLSVTGRFSYKGHALRSDPQALTDEMTLSRRHAAALTLRQYVTPHVAEQMQQWNNHEFLPESLKVTFEFQNRSNKIITFDFPVPNNTKENP